MHLLFDKIMRLHPAPRWIVAFLVFGMIAGLAFFALASCLMMFGYPFPAVIGGALGCGIGTGIIHATFLALSK